MYVINIQNKYIHMFTFHDILYLILYAYMYLVYTECSVNCTILQLYYCKIVL